MVEHVKEIRRETELGFLGDAEILEQGAIHVPRARTMKKCP
jgi:hypothetical protein